jgi:hypothetical protein
MAMNTKGGTKVRHFTTSIISIFFISLFAGQTIAADQQEYGQAGIGVQTGAEQPPESAGEQQQIPVENLTSEQVRSLQHSLQKQGVNPGPIDGIMGARTKQALREFQQEKGLGVTGQLNKQTMDALQLEVEEPMAVAPGFGIGQELRVEQQGALQVMDSSGINSNI